MIPLRCWLIPFLALCILLALATMGHAETGLSVSNMATRLGLRGRKKSEQHEGPEGPHLYWLRFCHQHFARREAGHLA